MNRHDLELVELYHTAAVALSNLPGVPSWYDRACWAVNEYAKVHAGEEYAYNRAQAYKALTRLRM